MLLGHFEQAWRESDAILARGRPDPNRLWDGLPFTGKRVVIRCLHGYGDAIQFLRYASALRREAAEVTVQVHPQLVALLEGMPWGESHNYLGSRTWRAHARLGSADRSHGTAARLSYNAGYHTLRDPLSTCGIPGIVTAARWRSRPRTQTARRPVVGGWRLESGPKYSVPGVAADFRNSGGGVLQLPARTRPPGISLMRTRETRFVDISGDSPDVAYYGGGSDADWIC